MISIVIPTLNERNRIACLLDSIVAQKIEEDIEVVIADAGSTDGTREFVRTYDSKLHSIIVEGGPPAIARNRGGRASHGDPIFFIDADMSLPNPEFLHTTVTYFRLHKLGVGATPLVPEGKNGIDHFFAHVSNLIMRIAKYIRPVGAQCIVTSRETYQSSGGYPEDRILFEDHDFVAACAKVGRYGVLPLPAFFSVRRMEKEGRLLIIWKYTYAALYRMTVGPITKPIFKYEFNHEKQRTE